MRDRIAPLIQERANWLFADRLPARLSRRVLDRVLSYEETVALASEMRDWPSARIMDRMGRRLARQVTCTGLDHVPATGPALIVANHPTGIADGIILHRLLAPRRPDAFFFANGDILRVLPQMEDMIAPVEWRKEKRSHAKTRATMDYMRRAVARDRLGVIFPSGRLAKRRGLCLHERPWMASAAMLARKFDLPVISVRMEARNSALFHLFDAIHPSLRDITLFHETLNKHRQPYRVTIGAAIAPGDIPVRPEEGIAMLRAATLSLAGGSGGREPAVPLLRGKLIRA
ncbi:1-acyl-sn-glycerol-3-phosphate acyltransferase [Primorskyibacter aestuariivivens]|uniref:1-acyl-sn-glycerol-3-phosphate acyltransferase n=1 Tax=Primorskyibacter aestuariivivens TaxID=1888912 RepID=UPI0022FFE571|nr:1-acyl-sn-glycerol-3-phosphate acyltransferase [Primorskyibacter aestuariivivens]MDA7428682.1 1-acyl-sn-glycerol-3-phosphate acyltransferase [Primorskyibacter aestuariivivens]